MTYNVSSGTLSLYTTTTAQAKVEARLNGWTAIKPSRETGEIECG